MKKTLFFSLFFFLQLNTILPNSNSSNPTKEETRKKIDEMLQKEEAIMNITINNGIKLINKFNLEVMSNEEFSKAVQSLSLSECETLVKMSYLMKGNITTLATEKINSQKTIADSKKNFNRSLILSAICREKFPNL